MSQLAHTMLGVATPRLEREAASCSLSSATTQLCGNASAAGSRSDHPWLNPGRLYQDALAFAEGSDCVARNFQRLMSVPRHIAGLQGRIVHYVTIACGPFFEKVDRILKRRYFPDQVSAFLQIDWSVEQLQGHCYLTENVGDQQGRRCDSAPDDDLFPRFFSFKKALVHTPINSLVAAE